MPTAEEIEAAMTPAGGWTKAQLAAWGVPWPPKKGWRRELEAANYAVECHGLDTPERVCFYEQDFYVLSNFSAFAIRWRGHLHPTVEHAYHWEKFSTRYYENKVQMFVRESLSAHEAFVYAQDMRDKRRPDWDDVKLGVMRQLLQAKVEQHHYVRRKLLATGNRELVENSWRDDFWGWGPNRDGQNMLGKLWMEVRAELRGAL